MAACHTENTSCYLSGSAPCRQGLEKTLMSVVSDKGVFIDNAVPFVCVYLCVTDTFLYPSEKCGGDRAPFSPDPRGLGPTTGSDWSHAGGTAGAG